MLSVLIIIAAWLVAFALAYLVYSKCRHLYFF